MVDSNLNLPEGYGVGISRDYRGEKKVSHLYKLDEDGNYGKPMCEKGYTNRAYGYSIFRGHTSKKGICKTCLDRAKRGLDGVDFRLKNFNKLSAEDQQLIIGAIEGAAVSIISEANSYSELDDSDIKIVCEKNLKNGNRLIYLVNVLQGAKKYDSWFDER